MASMVGMGMPDVSTQGGMEEIPIQDPKIMSPEAMEEMIVSAKERVQRVFNAGKKEFVRLAMEREKVEGKPEERELAVKMAELQSKVDNSMRLMQMLDPPDDYNYSPSFISLLQMDIPVEDNNDFSKLVSVWEEKVKHSDDHGKEEKSTAEAADIH
eukprot:gene16703-5128_t